MNQPNTTMTRQLHQSLHKTSSATPGKESPRARSCDPTIDEQKTKWIALIESGAKAILAGNETSDSVLNAVGGQASGDIRKTISQVTTPPLAAFTLAKRRESRGLAADAPVSDKPLVDHGIMINSLTWVVE